MEESVVVQLCRIVLQYFPKNVINCILKSTKFFVQYILVQYYFLHGSNYTTQSEFLLLIGERKDLSVGVALTDAKPNLCLC